MSQPPDRQTDKTSRWAFTAFKEQWNLFETMPSIVAEWGWQTEIAPDTQREHYQGFIRTHTQCRFAQMKKCFPGVHIEASRNWPALLAYCDKTDSAVAGTKVHAVSTKEHLTMSKALLKLAAHVPFSAPMTTEELLSIKDLEKFFKDQIDREYIAASKELIREDSELVGLYTSNVMKQAWHWYREVFLEKSIESVLESCDQQTDRQTDKGVPAFEI